MDTIYSFLVKKTLLLLLMLLSFITFFNCKKEKPVISDFRDNYQGNFILQYRTKHHTQYGLHFDTTYIMNAKFSYELHDSMNSFLYEQKFPAIMFQGIIMNNDTIFCKWGIDSDGKLYDSSPNGFGGFVSSDSINFSVGTGLASANYYIGRRI